MPGAWRPAGHVAPDSGSCRSGAGMEGTPGYVPEVPGPWAGGCTRRPQSLVSCASHFVEQHAAHLVPVMWSEEPGCSLAFYPGAWLVGISVGLNHDSSPGRAKPRGNRPSAGALQAFCSVGEAAANVDC